tara:strand:- start:758 stop:5713 length:4956 start_codon:yes stop_codon:yes gene_type:complete
MTVIQTNFIKGRMNKSVDERLLPPGEYVDALNVRLGSTEDTEIGSVENSKGNSLIAELTYDGAALSASAKCIGVLEDGANNTIYWFVHDSANTQSATGKVDMIVSYNVINNNLVYHVISTSVLNFNPTYLINGVNKIDELLFFTDNINPPRCINVTRAYLPPTALDVDQITAAELNVIKAPPMAAPTINLLQSGQEENFLEKNIVSFAYRYRYLDDEYSAISQFSDIAFVPSFFSLNTSDLSNAGMENAFNTAEVTFNTGSKLVKEIDLLFKYANQPGVYVIEKFNKGILGWSNNINRTEVFRHNQIYTALSDNQLTRLFDNVPKTAKSQTIMANRLMYGNYVDGYNVNNQLNYTVSQQTEVINLQEFTAVLSTGTYTFDITKNINDSVATFDFSNIDNAASLKQDSQIGFQFNFQSADFDAPGGGAPPGTPNQATTSITFTITLNQDYNSIYDLFSGTFATEQIGTATTIVTGPFNTNNPCNGATFTDILNCAITNQAPNIHTYSGIDGRDEPIKITTNPGSSSVSLQLVAAEFDDPAVAPNPDMFGYYKFTAAQADYSSNGNRKSLHSNRNYDVGIVYMDEYLRSTTALTSRNNTIYIPPVSSITANSLRVTIPTTMAPPTWASKYKFVVKRAEDTYETIYSVIAFDDDSTNSVWIRLEGDNQVKAKEGDFLIVKADVSGPLNTVVKTKVLAIESKANNFLTPEASQGIGTNSAFISEPAGLYMNLKPQGFTITDNTNGFFDSGQEGGRSGKRGGPAAVAGVPCFREVVNSSTGATEVENIAIPEGSLVNFAIRFNRNSSDGGFLVGSSDQKTYDYNRTVVASQDYNTLFEFVNGEGIDFTEGVASGIGTQPANVYTNTIGDLNDLENPAAPYQPNGNNRYQFYTVSAGTPPATGVQSVGTAGTKLTLGLISGTGGDSGQRTRVEGQVTINIGTASLILETEPLNADLDIYYENDEVFDITGGFHQSGSKTGDQNQTAVQPAIVNLGFFDCFAFGNGVESYKYLDELDGSSFTLGQRTTSVSEEDYKEANRYASVTYSGIYNADTNINRFNEFNLSDGNFKDLEKSFGDINILHSFETNLLVLQEDKISNVLLSKQALQAAEGSGVVATSTAVLGTQIARIEEYGISNNPESFAAYGDSRYFTDTSRGAVIQLKGTGGVNDKLTLISELGMRSYFRDNFITYPDTQKIGAFDPYMNEYVLSSNTIGLPNAYQANTEIAVECGATFGAYEYNDPIIYNINLGEAQGNVVVNYVITGTVAINYEWSSTTGNIPAATGTGSFNFNKNTSTPTNLKITITPSGSYTAKFKANCPTVNELTIINVALGSVSDDGLFIHDEFYWSDGTTTSPVESVQTAFSFTPFDTNRLARYTSITGIESEGLFPANNATVYMASNKIDFDTLVFNPAAGYSGSIPAAADKFSFLVSNTLYTSSQSDINALVAAATDITTVTNPSTGYYTGNFTYSNPTNQTYLYLIYNYAGVAPITLNFGATSLIACCLGSSASYYLNTSSFTTATSVYTDANLTSLAADGFYKDSSGNVREQSSGILTATSSCVTCNYIYISSVRPSTTDLCTNNYIMSVQAQTTTNHAFASVTPGDVLSVLPAGLPGFIAYSAVQNEDTATGTTFRIAEVNASGEIITLYFGGTGTCGAPL